MNSFALCESASRPRIAQLHNGLILPLTRVVTEEVTVSIGELYSEEVTDDDHERLLIEDKTLR